MRQRMKTELVKNIWLFGPSSDAHSPHHSGGAGRWTPETAESEIKMRKVTVIFESGYFSDREIDISDDEYWTAITEAQNKYDFSDEPIAMEIDGRRVDLDDDGDWMIELETIVD